MNTKINVGASVDSFIPVSVNIENMKISPCTTVLIWISFVFSIVVLVAYPPIIMLCRFIQG